MRVDPDANGKITVTVAVERNLATPPDEELNGWVYNLDFLATNATKGAEEQSTCRMAGTCL